MRTILVDLPLKCRGYIYEDIVTGDKVCVLNARLNHESNVKTYKHELRHDKNNDLNSNIDINTLENIAHEEQP